MKKIYVLIISLILLTTITINQKAYSNQTKTTDNNILTNTKIIYIEDNNTEGPWNGTIEGQDQKSK